MLRALFGVIAAFLLPFSFAYAQPVDVAHFVDPMTARSATISPSGDHIAFIRRTHDGEELVVTDITGANPQVVQSIRSTFGELNWVAWKGDDHILAGLEAYRGIAVERRSADIQIHGQKVSIYRVIAMNRDGSGLVQMFGQSAALAWGYGSTALLDSLPNDPGHVLVMASDTLGIGVWRADVVTGQVQRVSDGSDFTRSYTSDGAGYPVLRIDELPTGGYRVMRRASGQTQWINVMDVRGTLLRSTSPDFSAIGPAPGTNKIYVFARHDQQDRGGIYVYDTSTGAYSDPVFTSTDAEPSTLWVNPRTLEAIAGCAWGTRLTCQAHDPAWQRNINAVNAFFGNGATVDLVDMSDDTSKWLLRAESPVEGANYFIYDMAHHSVTPLVAIYPSVDRTELSPTQVVNYQSRDGTALWAYVTGQTGNGPHPMVVLPHGGPESRDTYGYDAFAQFLAAHGYVVLQPNFRGSGGSGRAFADAGRGQWGLRMQDDITDAVKHMIDAGVADPHKICIVGASYGGYAALAGAALTPDLYRCAISIAGVSDLPNMLSVERGAGVHSNSYQYWVYSIGDPGANRAVLVAASPARQAAHITAPILLIHGEDDQTVPISQSETMQRALNSAGHPTRLVRLPDANHYWDTWSVENRTILFHETETFLAQYLQ